MAKKNVNVVMLDYLLDKRLNYKDKGILMVLLFFGGHELDAHQITEIINEFGNANQVSYSSYKRLIKYGYMKEDRSCGVYKYHLSGEMPKDSKIENFAYSSKLPIATVDF